MFSRPSACRKVATLFTKIDSGRKSELSKEFVVVTYQIHHQAVPTFTQAATVIRMSTLKNPFAELVKDEILMKAIGTLLLAECFFQLIRDRSLAGVKKNRKRKTRETFEAKQIKHIYRGTSEANEPAAMCCVLF